MSSTSALSAAYDVAVNSAGCSGLQVLLNKSVGWRYDTPAMTTKPSARPSLVVPLQPFAEPSPFGSLRADQLPTVLTILIHGSQATGDTCEFSDVDVLVILDDLHNFGRDEHLQTVHELRMLLTSVFAFDSLMHHGLMWLQASALEDYDERFLPVETLQLSKVLFGPQDLRLSPRPPDGPASAQRVRAAAQSLRGQLIRHEHLRGDYQLKNLISGILLLPSLFLASKSVFVYKRRSFDLASEHFSASSWQFIELAEQIRRAWVRPTDPGWKKALATVGQPRSRALLSMVIPSRLNIKRPDQKSLLRALASQAGAFFTELDAAVR